MPSQTSHPIVHFLPVQYFGDGSWNIDRILKNLPIGNVVKILNFFIFACCCFRKRVLSEHCEGGFLEKTLISPTYPQAICGQRVPGGESRTWIEGMRRLRMSLKCVRRSKSGAHEYQEEEEGKTNGMDVRLYGRRALLRKASRRLLKQW